MGLSKKRMINIGIFLYLIIITIGLSQTRVMSALVVGPSRYLIILIEVLIIGLVMYKSKVSLKFVLSLLVFLGLLLYGLLLAQIKGDFDLAQTHLFMDVLLIITGAFLLSSFQDWNLSIELEKLFLFYVIVILFFTIAIGGLIFQPLPQFVLEVPVDSKKEVYYSQGLSKFYGVGAIAAGLLATKRKQLPKACYLFCMLFLLLLSLLGGARGDSIIAVFVCMLIVLKHEKFKVLFYLPFVLIALNLIIINIDYENLIFVKRFQDMVSGGPNARAQLYEQAYNLLTHNPDCFSLGCGLAYFQHYYSLEFGLYPHNQIIELVITYGIFLTTLIFSLTAVGLVVNRHKLKSMLFIVLFVFYFALLGMKSGYFLGNWLLVSFVLFCISSALLYKRP